MKIPDHILRADENGVRREPLTQSQRERIARLLLDVLRRGLR